MWQVGKPGLVLMHLQGESAAEVASNSPRLCRLCMSRATCPAPPQLFRSTYSCAVLQEVVEAGKWARGPWAGSPEDEQAILEVRRSHARGEI